MRRVGALGRNAWLGNDAAEESSRHWRGPRGLWNERRRDRYPDRISGVDIGDGAEIVLIGRDQISEHRAGLRLFPGGPQPVSGKRQSAAERCVEGTGRDYGVRVHSAHGDEEDDERAQGGDEDAVIRGANPAQEKREYGDEGDVARDSGVEEMKERGGEEQAREGSRDAQNAAAESGGEIGLQDDGDRHGKPVGALEVEAEPEGIACGDAEREANRMAEHGGLEREIGIEARAPAGEAQLPGLAGLVGDHISGEAGGGAKLAGERVDLMAGVANQGSEKRR